MSEKLYISEDGQVNHSYLHDALIYGLLLLPDKRLLIPVETTEGQRCCLVLHGVDRLKADDFREGNTLLDVTVSSSSTLDARDVADAYGITLNENPFFPKAMERLKNEGLITVRINPSYGCSLVCICQNIDIKHDISIFS